MIKKQVQFLWVLRILAGQSVEIGPVIVAFTAARF